MSGCLGAFASVKDRRVVLHMGEVGSLHPQGYMEVLGFRDIPPNIGESKSRWKIKLKL